MAVAAMLVVPGATQAATTFGSTLSAAPDPAPVTCDTEGCTAIYEASAGGVARAPADGVIVQWSIRSAAPGRVAPRIVRGDGPFVRGHTGSLVEVTEGLSTHPAQIAVRAGDRLAIVGGELPPVFGPPGSGASPIVEEHGRWIFDEQRDADGDVDGELLVQAVIEPDADGDGYGDETQDLCPGHPLGNLPCGPLTLTASAPPVLPPGGGAAAHTVVVRNEGRGPVEGVVVAFTRLLQPGTPHGTEPDVQGCTPLAALFDATRRCEIDRLAVGETREIKIVHRSVRRQVTTSVRVDQARGGSTWLLVRPPRPVTATTRVPLLHELRMTVAPHSERMRAERAAVDVLCPADDVGPCRARVEVRTARTPKGARRPRLLARRTVGVPAGEHTTVRLRFRPDAMRFLRARRTTQVKMTATRSFGTAGEVTGSARFTLRAARRR